MSWRIVELPLTRVKRWRGEARTEAAGIGRRSFSGPKRNGGDAGGTVLPPSIPCTGTRRRTRRGL